MKTIVFRHNFCNFAFGYLYIIYLVSMGHRILAINPGSTSTKIAVFENLHPVFESDIRHTPDELARFGSVWEQEPFRRQLVVDELVRHNIPRQLDAVIGRGCLARPVSSGCYPVTDGMIEEARKAKHVHVTDIACAMARDIALMAEPPCPALTADPGTVDEMAPEAHITGLPQIRRDALWHALNQKAVARRYAAEHATTYEAVNLIVCHLGGGISVAAHDHGRAIDVNNALDGEGPFSTERSGSLPAADLVRLCFSGRYTERDIMNLIAGNGGLMAYLGTNDMREIERRINSGDRQAKLLTDAMIWQTAKWIAAEGAVLRGKVDAIILTGGIAFSKYVVSGITDRVAFLAPVVVYPGQDEMLALAQNAERALGE